MKSFSMHEKSTSESKARQSVYGTPLDVEFYGIEHFYTIWQNAKVLLANRALFYPLKSL